MRLALAVLLLLALGATEAHAGLRLEALGQGPQLEPAGGGWLRAWTGPRSFELLRESDGWSLRVPVPDPCQAGGVRFPLMVVTCPDPRLMNLRTGSVTPVARRSAARSPTQSCEGHPGYYAFGRHWLQGSCQGHSTTFITYYLNWRSGEERGGHRDIDDAPPPVFFDIDHPELVEREAVRCPGLPGPSYRPPPPRWVVYLPSGRPGAAWLRRCSGGRSRLLSRVAESGVANDRVAAWQTRRGIGVYVIGTGRRVVWKLPRPTPGSAHEPSLLLISHSLYAFVPHGSDHWAPYLRFRVRLP